MKKAIELAMESDIHYMLEKGVEGSRLASTIGWRVIGPAAVAYGLYHYGHGVYGCFNGH